MSIKGTMDTSLYQGERYGNFSYAIPLANGNYEVILKFAELSWDSSGQRIFDIYVEGQRFIKNLDLYAVARKNTAYDVSFLVGIVDSVLKIDFVPLTGQATVSAILIRALPDSEKLPPSAVRLKRFFSTEPRTP